MSVVFMLGRIEMRSCAASEKAPFYPGARPRSARLRRAIPRAREPTLARRGCCCCARCTQNAPTTTWSRHRTAETMMTREMTTELKAVGSSVCKSAAAAPAPR
eukprot:5344215-Prymnesium_polylepis.1